jgi:hypothetical protein
MEKEFIPYELALRMKQLGFDETCMASRDMSNTEGLIQVPTYSQAFRWFREEHGMLSCIEFVEPEYGGDYGYKLYYKPGHLHIDHWNKGFKSYEEAELACLEKLIKVVELKKEE